MDACRQGWWGLCGVRGWCGKGWRCGRWGQVGSCGAGALGLLLRSTTATNICLDADLVGDACSSLRSSKICCSSFCIGRCCVLRGG
eukprot:7108551-Karenia_brevis.AAC.2